MISCIQPAITYRLSRISSYSPPCMNSLASMLCLMTVCEEQTKRIKKERSCEGKTIDHRKPMWANWIARSSLFLLLITFYSRISFYFCKRIYLISDLAGTRHGTRHGKADGKADQLFRLCNMLQEHFIRKKGEKNNASRCYKAISVLGLWKNRNQLGIGYFITRVDRWGGWIFQ